MAIESEDWWYIGGAAVGGAILGVAVQGLLGKREGGADVLSRRFRYRGQPGMEADASIVADFSAGAFKLEIYYAKNGGVAVATHDEVFASPVEAAEFTDEWAKRNELEPVEEWKSETLEEMKPLPAVTLEGRRKRR